MDMNQKLGIRNQNAVNQGSRMRAYGLIWLKRHIHPIIPYSLFLIPLTTRAQDFGLKATCIAAGLCKKGPEPPGPAALAGTIVGYLLAFIGVIFFGLMLYGGFLWMTSRGNTEQVKKAQDTITTSIIGIIIIFLSYVVTRFVVSRLTGAVGIGI